MTRLLITGASGFLGRNPTSALGPFACMIAERVGARSQLVRQGSARDFQAAARRGGDCSLVSAKLEHEFGIRPIRCSDGLDILAREGHLRPL